MTTGVLLLAAGSSRRFGSDKRLAMTANNITLLDHTLNNILAAKLPVCVCLRPGDITLQNQLTIEKIDWSISEHSALGMGNSIASGVTALPNWTAAVIALADMPNVQSNTYELLAEAAASNKIVIPTCCGKRGNPVCFGSEFFLLLKKLTGDTGAKKVIASNPNDVIEVKTDDSGIHFDVDSPEELKHIRA